MKHLFKLMPSITASTTNALSKSPKSENNPVSILKTNKAKAIRFSTLEVICKALNCQPSDILEYKGDNNEQ